MDSDVAIIGAGLSALTAARALRDRGLTVRLFEKVRGPGGRMSTRRTDDYAFDHGAQYFTVRDERFRRTVDAWIEDGVVREWKGRIGTAGGGKLTGTDNRTIRFVGIPRMSSIARHLSLPLDVRYGTRVERVDRDGNGWRLTDDAGADLGVHGRVVVTTPPAQAAPLLADAHDLRERVIPVRMLPCHAVMAVFDERLPTDFDGLFLEDSSLSWAARNSSKPDRPRNETWILHGSPDWSVANVDRDREVVTRTLLADFFATTGLPSAEPVHLTAHRWLYALAEEPLDAGCLWDADLGIGVSGDWCHGSRVEGAFLSGLDLAGRIE